VAGSPRKRAKNEQKKAEELRAERPEADPIPNAIASPTGNVVTPPDARARAQTNHAPARAPAPPRRQPPAMAPGPQLRSTVDQLQAEEVGQLARVLRPGLFMRIERLRPHWCAGWIEDYPIQDAQVTELLEYLSEEHGGNLYRVLVVSPDGQPYFETRLKIAGPPRSAGRLIDRDRWEGRERNDSPKPQENHRSNGNDWQGLVQGLGDMFRLVLDTQRQTADRTMDAVRSLNESQSQQTQTLISTIVESRERADSRGSFASQLREVAQANEALQEVKDALREPVTPGGEEDESVMNAALKAATTDFLGGFMKAKFAAGQRPKAAKNRGRRIPIDARRTMVDARVSGHGRGTVKKP